MQYSRPTTQNPDKVKCDTCGRWHLRAAPCKPEDVASWKKLKTANAYPAACPNNQSRPARFVKLVELDTDDEGPSGEVVNAAAATDLATDTLEDDSPYLQDFPIGNAA